MQITGTVHTSAKPRLTGLAISCSGDTVRCVQRSRCRAIVGRWLKEVINEAHSNFPYPPIVTNPANNPCSPLPTVSENFMQIRSEVFEQSC